jgi:hypothetical protein
MSVKNKKNPQWKTDAKSEYERSDQHRNDPCDFSRENIQEEARKPEADEADRKKKNDRIVGLDESSLRKFEFWSNYTAQASPQKP